MNVFTMSGVPEMGMVWMGAGQPSDISLGLMSNDNGEMLADQDSPYYTPSHHSTSNHSLDDMQMVQNSPMPMENLEMMHIVDMKQDSSDSSYMEDDNSQPVYMITTATQTLPSPTRKIKPVKHPGLVLKTPIAYQSNTDPSVIPIQKDGIAVCEKCGAIGVKHAFYTRERRFCSMACARGYSGLIPEPLPLSNEAPPDDSKEYAEHRFKMDSKETFTDFLIEQPLPQLEAPTVLPIEENLPSIRRKAPNLANSYDWDPHLKNQFFMAAPVTCFKHAPMSDVWENILIGMKVEVENTDCENVSEAFPDSFWVANVHKIIGYKALLRYEGFGLNSSKDFWVSLCSNQVHPVGWCATRGKPLIPPKTIQDKYSDWKAFLRKRLTGARTLPSNYTNKINESMKSRFYCGLNLEVVDKNRISQVKVAMVHKIVGKRLNVKYYDMAPDDPGFWCHEDSPLLHPVGWARKVGHNLVAPDSYIEKENEGIFDDDDATDDLFIPIQVGSDSDNTTNMNFCVGMKLEAIDPLNLSSICVATIMKVLNYGYIMIRIDTYDADATGADWFCYHVKSPCIFPAGFCEKNNIPLTPPKGYHESTFNWNNYLKLTNNQPVKASLFNQHVPVHGFVADMKIEAADLMDPRLVCVATIARVVDRLLRVHFDGWEEEYDQWLDCESPDIYPVGWCQTVGHKLEGPRIVSKQTPKVLTPPKVPKKRGRKKKIKDNPVKVIAQQKANNNKSSTEEKVKADVQSSGEMEVEDIQEEPEAGLEPAGPDQSLPTSTESKPPPERKATSYINSSNTNTSTKLIPRLVDLSGGNCDSSELCPDHWNVFDVAQFLRVNDCANYCDSFSKQKVDGKTLLVLSKEDIMVYTGGKVGPSLKIYDLIQQLKLKINPSQSRHMKANIKKFL